MSLVLLLVSVCVYVLMLAFAYGLCSAARRGDAIDDHFQKALRPLDLLERGSSGLTPSPRPKDRGSPKVVQLR